MKATLSFTLPEEAGAFEAASHATALAGALSQIMRIFRDMTKYADVSDETMEIIAGMRNRANEELEGLDLERMIS